MQTIEVYPTQPELMQVAAEYFVEWADKAMKSRGRFAVALSGGSTPRDLYALLATESLASRVDWPRVSVFWSDERTVPPGHLDSNYRMAAETLLEKVPIRPQDIYRVPAELPPEEAAARYEQTLREFFAGEETAIFDLMLLGMGGDGHTASLFPGTEAIHEDNRWVVGHYVPKLDVWRITMTPVVLNAARQVIFLVTGEDKAQMLRNVLHGPYEPDVFPAQVVRPESGNLLWLVDSGAASML